MNDSAIWVKEFLIKNKIHKKDFAKIIGVTLSYVYNLTDAKGVFTTKTATIERIATVMGVCPTDFKEYEPPYEKEPDTDVFKEIKKQIKKHYSNNLEFLKQFKKNQWVDIIDILRGSKPPYIEFDKFSDFAQKLKLGYDESFQLWKKIFMQFLEKNGFNIQNNKILLDAMLNAGYVTMQP